jgi:fatty acid desaturase
MTPPLDPKMLTKRVKWRDLTRMTPRDGTIECLHPLPWLAGSWMAAANGLWLAALPASFLFFLTALRLNHEAIHHNLGFGPRGHRIVLHALSALMLGSNNAVAANHMHHHRHVMSDDDMEGKCGRMRMRDVLAYGPRFPVDNHLWAWRQGAPAIQRRMLIDGALNLGVIATALATGWAWLLYHIAICAVAQCMTAFFAVWITHRGCEHDALIARTQRSKLVNLLSYNMFFHLEHHLFPGVPVKRLPVLAARIDAACPEIVASARRVVDWPIAPQS